MAPDASQNRRTLPVTSLARQPLDDRARRSGRVQLPRCAQGERPAREAAGEDDPEIRPEPWVERAVEDACDESRCLHRARDALGGRARVAVLRERRDHDRPGADARRPDAAYARSCCARGHGSGVQDGRRRGRQHAKTRSGRGVGLLALREHEREHDTAHDEDGARDHEDDCTELPLGWLRCHAGRGRPRCLGAGGRPLARCGLRSCRRRDRSLLASLHLALAVVRAPNLAERSASHSSVSFAGNHDRRGSTRGWSAPADDGQGPYSRQTPLQKAYSRRTRA